MRAGSLRWRLFAGAGLWIALALILAGTAIGVLFANNVERTGEAQLLAEFTRLVALIEPEGDTPELTSPMPDPRYATPFGGFYWQISDTSGSPLARSRSLWDATIDAAERNPPASGRFLKAAGPTDQNLTVFVRNIRFPGSNEEETTEYLVAVAQDRAALDRSILRFATDLIVSLVILAVVLMGAAWLQIRLGLAPLHAIRSGIEAIRQGKAEQLPNAYPTEVQPLVRSVNDLIASQEKSMQFARARAADLAHSLKTPLAVLGSTATSVRTSGDSETADLLETLAQEMAGRVDYQLRLSRLRMRDTTHAYATPLRGTIERTVNVISRTPDGERLRWVTGEGADFDVDIEQHDLVELLGVLLENAAKWARSKVEISIEATSETAALIISDDGPGLTEAQIADLGSRGKRLDENKPGHGLGLAIAYEIVEMNRGTMEIRGGSGRGLRVKLQLPLVDRG